MKIDRTVTINLAQIAKVMNVIGGGITSHHSNLIRNNNHYLLIVKAPGVSADQFTIELHNENLFVFQNMNFDASMKLPYLIHTMKIPADVDFEMIHAEYEDKTLKVIMPFNQLANGYHRDVEISGR